ncbi:MAG: HAMP domain-containing protein [Burkholderiales bacterium]|nr:HAMP domain-containing protein [Anaerolineae bacterium]
MRPAVLVSGLVSLRTRLVLWTVALEAGLLLLFAVLLVIAVQNNQNQQINAALRLSSDQLGAVVDTRDPDDNESSGADDGAESSGAANDLVATDSQQRSYEISPQEIDSVLDLGISAWILSLNDEVVITLGDADGQPVPVLVQTLPLDQLIDTTLANGDPVRLVHAVLVEDDEPFGSVVLAYPLKESQQFIQQVWVSLAVLIPFILILSSGGGWFLADRALKPVATITKLARQISADDLSQRLRQDGPNDEIGQLAQTLDGMLERLETAFDRERQFTSDVSHELRTPLALLKTSLSLARSRPREAAALVGMMSEMEHDVDRMTHLVEQMLILARMEHQEPMPLEAVLLDGVVKDVVQELRPKAQANRIQLSLDVAAPLSVQGSADLLKRLLLNLIDNAVKYTPAGGAVTVRASQRDQTIEVAIEDSGAGIEADQLPHIFERFYRADSARARETGGFGLGLAIARTIVEAHRGTISVQSQPGMLTTFTVRLPAYNA